MEELIQLVIKKIADIEKKLEKYYQLLKTENELNFILNGTYLLNQDIENILIGNY